MKLETQIQNTALDQSVNICVRMLRIITHRSPAGPSREMIILEQRVCRRCTSVTLGVVIGSLIGIMYSFKFWMILLVAPAIIEAVIEKAWIHKCRPQLLTWLNVLAGICVGVVSVRLIHSTNPQVVLALFFCVLAVAIVRIKLLSARKVDQYR